MQKSIHNLSVPDDEVDNQIEAVMKNIIEDSGVNIINKLPEIKEIHMKYIQCHDLSILQY